MLDLTRPLIPTTQPHPADGEAARLEALYRYDIMDTVPETGFDRITRLARSVMQTPMAMISLVDRNRQWFKSCAGEANLGCTIRETPREVSFCAHAIDSDQPFIIPDARQDARFRNNKLVVGAPFIRFYLGVPLRTPDGFNIGTLCVIDQVPRHPSAQRIAMLQDLAGLVVDELELRQIADTDPLTGVMTRRSLTREAERAVHQANRHHGSLSCLMIDIDHFKTINDCHGHAAGDQALRAVTAISMRCLRTVDLFGRLGGEEFVAILPDASVDDAHAIAERLLHAIANTAITIGDATLRLTASLGLSSRNGRAIGLHALLEEADAALYQAKSGGRNQVAVAALDHPGFVGDCLG